MLLSGTIAPSFAQAERNDFTFFDFLKQKTPTHIQSFSATAIILTSSTTGGPVDDSKVTICHVPPRNPSKAHTITVGKPAVFAHLSHGDYLGECNTYSLSLDEKAKSDNQKDKKGNSGKGKR